MRHLDVVEQEETVVHGVVTKFGSDISNVDVLKRQVCLHVADLDDEWVRAVRLALEDELCHDNGMVGSAA
jgi:hypothetical protein